jgi:hypothetical protein
MAAGFGVGTATAWRNATEVVALLAVWASKLHQVLASAKDAEHACLVIEGTVSCFTAARPPGGAAGRAARSPW